MAIAPTGTELPRRFDAVDLARRMATAKPRERERARRRFEAMFGCDDLIHSRSGVAWDRATCLTLARERCLECGGLGQVARKNGPAVVCSCVYRRAFRECRERRDECCMWQGALRTGVSLSPSGFRSRKIEEYVADFERVGLRELRTTRQRVQFTCGVLRGATNDEAMREMTLRGFACSRSQWFSGMREIEEHLGRVYHELEPFALHPVDLYFNEIVRRGSSTGKLEPSSSLDERVADVHAAVVDIEVAARDARRPLVATQEKEAA